MRETLRQLFGRRGGEPELEKAIGYRFSRPALLEMALIHRSYRFESAGTTVDNQRLEFLGDAVLGLLTAAYMYDKFADHDEGVLTTLRSQLTSGQALARVGTGIGLGKYLKMGKGEERTGGCNRPTTLADAIEAVVGAAYLDGGMRACQRIFNTLFVPHIRHLDDDLWAGNPKGKLQEVCQRRWKTGPQYHIVRKEGPAHAQVFAVDVRVNGDVLGSGSGTNKQEAEAQAAANALRSLLRGAKQV